MEAGRRSRRDCGNLEAVHSRFNMQLTTTAAVAATAAILRRKEQNAELDRQLAAAVAATAAILRRGTTLSSWRGGCCRSRRDCGNLEAATQAMHQSRAVSAAVAATAAILRRTPVWKPDWQLKEAAVAATAAILRRKEYAVCAVP